VEVLLGLGGRSYAGVELPRWQEWLREIEISGCTGRSYDRSLPLWQATREGLGKASVQKKSDSPANVLCAESTERPSRALRKDGRGVVCLACPD